MNYESMSEEEINKLNFKPCPHCGGKLEIEISPCLDPQCCGIEHSIHCEKSGHSGPCKKGWYLDESWDLEILVERWVKR